MVNGVAKTYAMTGWRVGWMIGPKDVIKAATNLQSHLTSNVCNVAQQAALTAVSGSLDAVAEMRSAFDRRRQLIVGLLDAIPGVSCPEPQGAFYAYPSVTGLIGKSFDGVRPAVLRSSWPTLILEKAEVAVVPGRGLRHARVLPAVLRAGRRGSGHRRHQDGGVPGHRHGLSSGTKSRSCGGMQRTRAAVASRDQHPRLAQHGLAVELRGDVDPGGPRVGVQGADDGGHLDFGAEVVVGDHDRAG